MNLDRKPIKLYKVVFNEYTNCMNNCVSAEMEYKEWDLNKKADNSKPPICISTKTEYIHIPQTGTLVVREDELDLFKKFGNGFRTIELVGEMYVTE